jgi:hypothetical protein
MVNVAPTATPTPTPTPTATPTPTPEPTITPTPTPTPTPVYTGKYYALTFSDYGVTGQRLAVYNNSSFVGEYNSSSTIFIDDLQDYVITFKPSVSGDLLSDPFRFVDSVKNYLPTLLVWGFILLILLGICLIIKRVIF